jgi:hypothetical protein
MLMAVTIEDFVWKDCFTSNTVRDSSCAGVHMRLKLGVTSQHSNPHRTRSRESRFRDTHVQRGDDVDLAFLSSGCPFLRSEPSASQILVKGVIVQ